ncbi:ribokinase [Arthrobacter sp. efr-133-R2A-120]|uniref:ribokinase n=1 Tax=Arthrobacter sp. efr-133-R2A-120 TaxID=3040277 RepID=UPI00254D98A7|nr:ribokinase [Arthrobacter sp. efr-133-R2A-120]
MTLITMVGSLNLDTNVRVERFTQPGETLMGYGLDETAGGKSFNQAAAAARLGGAVRLIGAVGDDPGAEYLLGHARDLGIDTRFTKRLAGFPTGRAIIHVDADGENMITVIAGANDELRPADVGEAGISGSHLICLALETPVETVFEAALTARRIGARVILNLSPFKDLPDELLSLVDVVVMNEREAALFVNQPNPFSNGDFSALTDRLIACGVANAVVTLGASGATTVQRVQAGTPEFKVEQIPALPANAVDTTGCGDAFTGALAYGLALGDDLNLAVRLANAAGGFAAEHRGAQSSYADKAELSHWMDGVAG